MYFNQMVTILVKKWTQNSDFHLHIPNVSHKIDFRMWFHQHLYNIQQQYTYKISKQTELVYKEGHRRVILSITKFLILSLFSLETGNDVFLNFRHQQQRSRPNLWLSGYINTWGYVKKREDNPKVANIDGAYDYWRQGGWKPKTCTHLQSKHNRHEEQIIFHALKKIWN